ncbi:hypothetical protein R6Q59_028870 [Mikania micrantha]
MDEHEHPLTLIDLWSEQLQHEEEDEEDEEDGLIAKQDFRCLCCRCKEEITLFDRYYYTCCQCNLSFHKFCANLPETLVVSFHEHTLMNFRRFEFTCVICQKDHEDEDSYHCPLCYYNVDVKCAMKSKSLMYHPSHPHPFFCIVSKQILCECFACGKEHKGIFYICSVCYDMFLHSHCAFLPNKLQIQHTTNNVFSHIHPLTLAYTFPTDDQKSKFYPNCRVCLEFFYPNLWIYRCEKCRYYVHLGCATSREEPFMSILTSPGTGKLIRNYEEANYPNLLHLPFPDPSYSLLKHLFFEENISITTIVGTKTHNISHQHPLILDCSTDHDITRSIASSSRIVKTISFHDPMKSIQLLCDGCVRPITTKPIYMCANEDCNFVLHEWCTRLPVELKSHYSHPQHTRLVLRSKSPDKFFKVFYCDICGLPCNGFVYHCEECGYNIDVNCAFIPEEITHASHPNHLLSRVRQGETTYKCRICSFPIWEKDFTYSCKNCDNFYLHPWCALLIPETTRHKCDKHPMKLSYFPIENHKSEYFCEICEEELNPQLAFYHCYECMQSMHPACAPSILCYETHTGDLKRRGAIYKFANHPLNLIDLWSEQLQHEEEDEEDEEDGLIAKQDFRCLCCRCKEEITWFDRYYYTCCQCNLSFHKFCANLPETLMLGCHEHTLILFRQFEFTCNICQKDHVDEERYRCSKCYYDVDVKCAMKSKSLMYHPSHPHPFICISTIQILCECFACGKEHKGSFFQCSVCYDVFLHSHCAFLPNKLQIQHTTNNFYSHIHPLTLAYTFPRKDQESKYHPKCRVCLEGFINPNLWIYKCEKCRYYAHLDCATSREEPFMSFFKSPEKTCGL